MENEEKNLEAEEHASEESEGGLASRARNRTVMLTPEITGEVRARIARDLTTDPESPADSSDSGFALGSSYSPSTEQASSGFDAPPAPAVGPAPTQPAAIPTPPPAAPVIHASVAGEQVIWTKRSPVVGFLVSYDKDKYGSVFELRAGRLIVSSEAAGSGNCLLVQDDTVSPMHAIMRISPGGSIQVLDQLSEFGTRIKRLASGIEEELSGEKSILVHGDTIMFGERTFHLCTVVREMDDDDAIEDES